MIDSIRLRELLDYCPVSGIFRWNGLGRRLPGSRAGTVIQPRGVRRIRIGSSHYAEHRLAWLYMTGQWPSTGIDHKNGNPADNRFDNLREATIQQNTSNTRKVKRNKWGYRGVKKRHGRSGWTAMIRHNGKRRWLGVFPSPEEAHAAYVDADRQLRGEFAATLPDLLPPKVVTKIAPEAYPSLTAERLREVVEYNPTTGIFFWRINGKDPRHRDRIGKPAGTVDANGYLRLIFDGRNLYAHKMAYLCVFGHLPEGVIDHINGVRSDNRMSNLRLATQAENMRNRASWRSTLPKGVHKSGKRWRATIVPNGRHIHLGTFDTPEEAHAAYVAAAHEHFGEFADAGRSAVPAQS